MAPVGSGPQSAAELLRAQAAACFAKGKYAAAAEKYTEAICLAPGMAVLYSNRAMCSKKRGGSWQAVEEDCRTALRLDRDNMRAHYLLGVALRERGDLAGSARHLTRALEAARERGDAIKDEIWRELAKSKYQAWKESSRQRAAEDAELKEALLAMMAAQEAQEAAAARGAAHGQQQPPGSAAEVAARYVRQREQLSALFERAARLDTPGEVPTALTCPISMSVMRDPATTSAGVSYDRAVLVESLAKSAQDPVTRAPVSPTDLHPNLNLRNAIQDYLDEHPWAWGECI